MADEPRAFEYLAIDPAGRRVRGSVPAGSDGGAFAQLKRQGLAPLRIRPARRDTRGGSTRGLTDREAAEFLGDIAALLQAGSNMPTAISVIGAKAHRSALRAVCKTLASEINRGASPNLAFGRALGRRHAFVPSLVAAAEAAGDLAGGMLRASEMLGSRVRLRDQLVSALSYPAFVLAASMVAVGILLFLVIPSLAPLLDQPGVKPPVLMMVMVGLSGFLRANAAALAAAACAGVVIFVAAGRFGLLADAVDRFALDGPFGRITRALVYGAFAAALGDMLAAGAPMTEALRLATNSVQSGIARKRLTLALQSVRQGRRLSDVLEQVSGFPRSVVRLAAIGEASGALGATIARAGKLEEDAALRQIETVGRLIGPTLIVILGGLIGLLMGGLLTGVSQLGNSAL